MTHTLTLEQGKLLMEHCVTLQMLAEGAAEATCSTSVGETAASAA